MSTPLGIHPAYEGFIIQQESYHVSLSNLYHVVGANSKNKRVFIVENQMVFSQLCEELAEYPVSLMCTAGQMRVASLVVIALLCQGDNKLYYAGDMDPEGIEIANKIISRHPNHIVPWRYTIADYWLSQSNEIMNQARLSKLDKIQVESLQEVVELIKHEKKAGYQEALIKSMIEDVKKTLL